MRSLQWLGGLNQVRIEDEVNTSTHEFDENDNSSNDGKKKKKKNKKSKSTTTEQADKDYGLKVKLNKTQHYITEKLAESIRVSA
jgi:hypothetical protein